MGFAVTGDRGVLGVFDHRLVLEFPARQGLALFRQEVLGKAIPNAWVVRMKVEV
jgi:hypothetical protein